MNNIVWNTFFPSLFLSCAAEQTIHLWHIDITGFIFHRIFETSDIIFHLEPILSYDVGYQVNDVAWAPYSSTVFALVTGDGGIRVFDLHLNKYKQICKQVSNITMIAQSIFKNQMSLKNSARKT